MVAVTTTPTQLLNLPAIEIAQKHITLKFLYQHAHLDRTTHQKGAHRPHEGVVVMGKTLTRKLLWLHPSCYIIDYMTKKNAGAT
jgi:hypothetical protein